jgi:diadenosine tetraphosphatase ApaH/serine/threonine PP2A family protein phosphatase
LRYLVISDLHGNWEALDAVLSASSTDAVDQVLVLGDLVGYGASPNEVVERIRAVIGSGGIVRGNHDKIVAGVEDASGFNEVARAAAEWTTNVMTPDNLEFLEGLPQGPVTPVPGLVICHGSPLDEDEYVLGIDDAEQIFGQHRGPMTFYGHTHVPMLLTADGERISVTALEGDALTLEIDPGKRYMINPGSVGQPRDRDARAAYLIYDSSDGRIVWRRQEYALEQAQRRILDAGLPQVLAYRLAAGI